MYGILSVYCWSSDSTEWHLWLILKKPFGRFLFEGEALIFFWIEDFPKPHEDVSSSCHAHEQSSFWSIHQSLYFGSDHLTSLEEQHPAVTSTLDKCLYVDDLICCAQSVEAADGSSQLAQTMQEWIYANGAQTLENFEIKWKNTVFKVLGLMWGIEEDDFVFDLRNLMDFLVNKGGELQATAQTFDPVGCLSPFTIQAKCLFQQMWEHDLEWDNELPNDLLNLWQQWCTELLTSEIETLADVLMQMDQNVPVIHVFIDSVQNCQKAGRCLMKWSRSDLFELFRLQREGGDCDHDNKDEAQHTLPLQSISC